MICDQCKANVYKELSRKKGHTVNCMAYHCERYPNRCSVSHLVQYVYAILIDNFSDPDFPEEKKCRKE